MLPSQYHLPTRNDDVVYPDNWSNDPVNWSDHPVNWSDHPENWSVHPENWMEYPDFLTSKKCRNNVAYASKCRNYLSLKNLEYTLACCVSILHKKARFLFLHT